MYDFLIDFFKELLRAWREGTPLIRRFLVAGTISATIGISAAIINNVTRYYGYIFEPIAVIFGVAGAIFGFGVFIYRKSLEDSE
ncbi:hypothetical protein L2750_13560 [Shewanella submarina]|uniref:Uncharacterized protein n=1 Tax=Shewanella submarina TaxID=2016376 RepID=A0ABV7GHS1_9GAMM|nr:hypothetical protein [Shewanella submarina]MCL1038173.1 hypothetical protein [Shewanella submarina]